MGGVGGQLDSADGASSRASTSRARSKSFRLTQTATGPPPEPGTPKDPAAMSVNCEYDSILSTESADRKSSAAIWFGNTAIRVASATGRPLRRSAPKRKRRTRRYTGMDGGPERDRGGTFQPGSISETYELFQQCRADLR